MPSIAAAAALANYDDVRGILGVCRGLPCELGELATFFVEAEYPPAAVEAIRADLASIRKPAYEAVLAAQQQQQQARALVVHYCHLVFWSLCRRYLSESEHCMLMGDSFSNHAHAHAHVTDAQWYNLDELGFGLPIDIDNVPAAVDMGDSACMQLVAGVLRSRQRKQTMQVKEKLWRFKAFVAQRLCAVAQSRVFAHA